MGGHRIDCREDWLRAADPAHLGASARGRCWSKRDGVSTADAQRIKDLERENRELRKANEILKLASAFFAQAELDRRIKS